MYMEEQIMRQGLNLKISFLALTLAMGSIAFGQQQPAPNGIVGQAPAQQGQAGQPPQISPQGPPEYSQQPPLGFDPSMLVGTWKTGCGPQNAFANTSNFIPNGGNSQDMDYVFAVDVYGQPTIQIQVNDYDNPSCVMTETSGSNSGQVGHFTYSSNDPFFGSVGRIIITWFKCFGVGCHFFDPATQPYGAAVQSLMFNQRGAFQTLNFVARRPDGALLPAFRRPLTRPEFQNNTGY
jgi:hypothetical protein